MVIAATLRDAPDHREPREERRGADATTADAARRRDVHFALESAVPTVTFECKMHLSAKKRTDRPWRGLRRPTPMGRMRLVGRPGQSGDDPRPRPPEPVESGSRHVSSARAM